MEIQEYIPIDIFCRQHGVDITFISSLEEYGLIELVKINEADCLTCNQLVEVEKFVRLNADLEINLEGIDVITHLLNRVKEMQDEMQQLKNKLRLYEVSNLQNK